MSNIRKLMFGFLIISGNVIAQDNTTVSELQSLETSTPAEDAATTADLVVKGYIPDLQRSQMVEDAVTDAKRVEQKKLDAAAKSRAQKAAVVKSEATPAKSESTAGKTESLSEKERNAKEAADRANGIAPGKTTTAKTAVTTAKTDSTQSSAHKGAVPAEKASTMLGQSVGDNNTVVPLDDPAETKTAAEPSVASDGTMTITGRLTSLNHGANGTVRAIVESESHGKVEVVVQPRRGSRIPIEGSKVTLRGKKIGSSERALVVQADTIERIGSAPIQTNSPPGVAYRRGYVRRVPPGVPMGPVPGPPPVAGPYPPSYY